MNDDSAEWMAELKASGQLWPDPQEGGGGVEGERQERPQVQRVEAADPPEGLGVARGAVTDEGQQVLGTCSPELTVTLSALLSRLQRIHDDTLDGIGKYRVELCMDEVRKVLRGES